MKNQTKKPTPRKNRTIVLPFDQGKYMDIIEDSKKFRKELDEFINELIQPLRERLGNRQDGEEDLRV